MKMGASIQGQCEVRREEGPRAKHKGSPNSGEQKNVEASKAGGREVILTVQSDSTQIT